MTETLYRAYRPARFADLVGQDSARLLLQRAVARGRVGHAYLFTGPRGTGKTTSARLFARSLVCTDLQRDDASETAEPCGRCEACVSVLAGRAVDVVEIDAASHNTVEDVRELRDQARFPPLALSRKIYVLDEAHMLSREAFNAFLKVLEEPPAACIFILATTEQHKVPLTVRSRCQPVRFVRGSAADIAAKLRRICDAEGWKAEAAALTLIAEHADGGYRDAETLLEQFAGTELTEAAAAEALGAVPAALRASLLRSALAGDVPSTAAALSELRGRGEVRPEVLARDLARAAREMAYASSDPRPAAALLAALVEAQFMIRQSPDPLLPLEAALLTFEPFGAPEYSKNTSTNIVRPLPKPATSVAHAVPGASVKPAPLLVSAVPVLELREAPAPPQADIRAAWKEVIKAITRESQPLSQMLREATVHTAEAGVVTLHIRYKFVCEKLAEKKNRVRVEELLKERTGQPWAVRCELVESVPKRQVRAALPPAGGVTGDDVAATFG